MSKPLDAKGLTRWRDEFEAKAREYGARGDWHMWNSFCCKLWTIEFVMGLGDEEEGYQQPHQRVPLAAKGGAL